jgi:hypothetical protein
MADAKSVADSQDEFTEVDLDPTDELAIEVVDDRPEDDRRPLASEEDLAKADNASKDDLLEEVGERTKQRIKTLTWQRHEERRHKEEAQRLADEAVKFTESLTKENERLRRIVEESSKAITDQATKRAEGAISAAEERLRIAHEEGDSTKIATAQTDLTNAVVAKGYAPNVAANLIRRVQTEMDADPKTKAETTVTEPLPTVPEPDPRAMEWQKSNQWFGQNKVMTSTAYGIHEQLVVEEGVDPDTDEYYNRIDAEMRKIFPGQFEDGSGGAETDVVDISEASSQANTPRRANTVVAPATRNNGSKPPRTVKLTATEVRLAKRLGLSNEQYAIQKLKEQQ